MVKIPSMTNAKLQEIHLQRLKELRTIELCIGKCKPITTKLNVTSIQIDLTKGLLRIIPAIDSRNTHWTRTQLHGHPIVTENRTRHIATMQKRQ
jgi:hypothetical protein